MDVLATRYHWSRKDILEDLYWEELTRLVVFAANANVTEDNADRKFTFMLHVDKKGQRKWKDAPLPFPKKKKRTEPTGHKGGLDQLEGLPEKYRITKP